MEENPRHFKIKNNRIGLEKENKRRFLEKKEENKK